MEPLSDEELLEIETRADLAQSAPWRAMIEGRDHASGDSFVMIGDGPGRGEDMYISLGNRSAPAADLDFIASARSDVPRLVQEIRRLNQVLAVANADLDTPLDRDSREERGRSKKPPTT